MAALHIAQIEYLSQDLIEHVKNANNLIMRSKHELARIQQIAIMFLTVLEELEKDAEYEQQCK
ncbi:MAG: hypothetical protein H0X26_07695 [Alphaproteobacteria bacterium]|nr:hypothetical protein [Alphaproteobacteria bacterium]